MENKRNFFDTPSWKNFMAKVYGWGASVVIIGILFKLMHWPFASYFIVIGLGVEAIIFFLYAFERPYKDYDWEIVFPELEGGEQRTFSTTGQVTLSSEGNHTVPEEVLQRFEKMMGQLVAIDPATFQRLETSLKKLNTTTEGLVDLTQLTSATEQYTAGMQKAADTVSTLNLSFQQTSEGLQQSLLALSLSYQTLALNLKNEMSKMGISNDTYLAQLDALNKNLSMLNTVYVNMLSAMNVK